MIDDIARDSSRSRRNLDVARGTERPAVAGQESPAFGVPGSASSGAATPTALTPAAMLRLQSTAGNQAVLRMVGTRHGGADRLQRQDIITMPPDTFADNLPIREWHVQIAPAEGGVKGKWIDPPPMHNAQVIAVKFPSANAPAAAFSTDWTRLQSAWNESSARIDAYEKGAQTAEVEGLFGPALPGHAEGVLQRPAAGMPGGPPTAAGKQIPGGDAASLVEYGKVGPAGGETVGSLFDGGGGLKTDASKVKKSDDLNKSVNAVTQAAEHALATAVRGVGDAGSDVVSSIAELKKAVLAWDISGAKGDQAKAESTKLQVEREKAIVMGGLDAIANVFSAGESYLGARSGGPKKEPSSTKGEAAASGGVASGLVKYVAYFVGQSYDKDIHQLNVNLDSLKNFVARNEAQMAQHDITIKREAVKKAQRALDEKRQAVVKAEQDRRDALVKLAADAGKAARAGGASAQDAARIETAIRALPAIEHVLSRLSEIVDKSGNLPQYTTKSGRGMTLAGNRAGDEFIWSYNLLLGAKARYAGYRPLWESRRQSVQSMISSLHS